MIKGISIKEGNTIFNDDKDSMLIGIDLSKYLNVDYNSENYLSVMSDFGDGINLGSFFSSGAATFHSSFADANTIYFPLHSIYNVFGLDNGEADNLLVYLRDYKKAYEIKTNLNEYFSNNYLPYEARDWKDVNGFLLSVIDMNANNYFVALIIISILVFFSVMQTLTTSFLERLNEFGAIRAIGVSIQNLTFLLVTEVILFVKRGIYNLDKTSKMIKIMEFHNIIINTNITTIYETKSVNTLDINSSFFRKENMNMLFSLFE